MSLSSYIKEQILEAKYLYCVLSDFFNIICFELDHLDFSDHASKKITWSWDNNIKPIIETVKTATAIPGLSIC